MTDKRWVILAWKIGRATVASDHGDFAWNSPLYRVIGFMRSYDRARVYRRRVQMILNRAKA